MNNIKKDVFVGVVLFSGIISFISGSFIVSTLLFGMAAVLSTMLSHDQVRH